MDDSKPGKVEVGRWDEKPPRGPRREGPGFPGSTPNVKSLESLAWLLDSSIKLPGLNYRVGLDALIGLVPGLGDLVGTALSAWILVSAARLGVPRATLLRMGFNIVLEALVGLVPVVGDLFDFVWKANRRNIELLQAHLANSKQARRQDWAFASLFLLIAAGILGLIGWGMVGLIQALVS